MSAARARTARGLLLLGFCLVLAVPGIAQAQGSGTVKVTLIGAGGPANQPHAGCGFQAVMYGFGAAERGTVTVSRIAPTGGGVVGTQSGLLSDDRAGGSSDVDQAFVFTAAGLGLSGSAPDSRGWHLKVAVRPDDGPSASKTVWMACPAAAKPGVATPKRASVGAQQHRTPAAVVPQEARDAFRPVARAEVAAAAPAARAARAAVAAHYPSRIPAEDLLGPTAPRRSLGGSPWLELKLFISVVAATLIASRLGAWTGVRRPLPWRAGP